MLLNGVRATVDTEGVKLVRQGDLLATLPLVKAREEHRSFIISTWVRSGIQLAKLNNISRAVYLEEEPKVAESRWQDCYVVGDPEDDFVVLAWICGSVGMLHHVYVVPEFRRKGIAGGLIEVFCGKEVQTARAWPYPGKQHWVYNPYKGTSYGETSE